MRLFIAINFNNETRTRLVALCNELRSSKHGRFTLPENLHLTLAFLGECSVEQTASVKAAMDAVEIKPFDLVIERIGRFKRDDGDIWWAGIEENRALADLQSRLTEKLIAEDFSFNKRKYNPHITLGRMVVTNVKPHSIVPFRETVSRIDLMKSERINGILMYKSIYQCSDKEVL